MLNMMRDIQFRALKVFWRSSTWFDLRSWQKESESSSKKTSKRSLHARQKSYLLLSLESFLDDALLNPIWHRIWKEKNVPIFSSTKFRVKTTFMRLNVQWNCLKFTSYQKFRQTIAWRNLWLANLAPNLSTCQIKKNVKSQCVKISLLKRQDLVATSFRVRTWN